MSPLTGLRRFVPALIPWVAAAVVALQLPMPLRALLVVLSAAWAPGAAFTWLLESEDRLERAVLTVTLSLSATTVVAVALSIFHQMVALRALATIAVLSTIGVALREVRS
jgi:hypothetical protein